MQDTWESRTMVGMVSGHQGCRPRQGDSVQGDVASPVTHWDKQSQWAGMRTV